MKIDKKLLVLWLASMALFISIAIATWLGMAVMEGVSGLTIRFFLGYCGIIIVSQVFSAVDALRQFFADTTADQPATVRGLLR